jgi:putative copper resistance protein D
MIVALLIIARTAQFAASILLAGTFTFQLVVLGPAAQLRSDDFREVERRLFDVARWSLVVALFSALLWFWLEVANMSGLPLTHVFSKTAWQAVLFETEFGRVWQLRLGLIAIAVVFAISGPARNEARWRRVSLVLWFLSVALLVSLAWISHAAAAPVQPLGLLGDALHLCAAGAWIGGLASLAIFLARARASFTLGELAAPVLKRFSTLSLSCVSILVICGVSNSWLLVGSMHALFTTRYGWLLLLKLALFCILVGLGARNRLVIKTKLLNAPPDSEMFVQLRRRVICEACLGLAVVIIVACLGVTPPARH